MTKCHKSHGWVTGESRNSSEMVTSNLPSLSWNDTNYCVATAPFVLDIVAKDVFQTKPRDSLGNSLEGGTANAKSNENASIAIHSDSINGWSLQEDRPNKFGWISTFENQNTSASHSIFFNAKGYMIKSLPSKGCRF